VVCSGSGAHDHVRAAFGLLELASELFCATKDITIALHDQRGHPGTDELRETGRSLPPGRARWGEWKAKGQNAGGTRRRCGSASYAGAAASSARHQNRRDDPGLAHLETRGGRHRGERHIEPRRGYGSSLAGYPIRLFDKSDCYAEGARRPGDEEEVRRGDAAARSMTQQEERTSALELTRNSGVPCQPGQTAFRRYLGDDIGVNGGAHAVNRSDEMVGKICRRCGVVGPAPGTPGITGASMP
jgi:hypothetical protein